MTASARRKAGLSLLWHASYCTQEGKTCNLAQQLYRPGMHRHCPPSAWLQPDTPRTWKAPGCKEVGPAHRAAGSTHGHLAAVTAPTRDAQLEVSHTQWHLKSRALRDNDTKAEMGLWNSDKAHSPTNMFLPYMHSSRVLSLARHQRQCWIIFSKHRRVLIATLLKNGTRLIITCNSIKIIHCIQKITEFEPQLPGSYDRLHSSPLWSSFQAVLLLLNLNTEDFFVYGLTALSIPVVSWRY